ncbi:MAG: hypothetical protein FJ220_03235, partial [Kiritimatiellaceae bacterium]|nr:hypothetical protein [Kiritimatiellaceae bacterium]
MNRVMIRFGGVLIMMAVSGFAGVVEQGLTVRGRAEELLQPTCAFATVYAEERFTQTDLALKSAETLAQKIIKQVNSRCEVRDVQVRTETFTAKTAILNTKNTETREHLVRQRIRFK